MASKGPSEPALAAPTVPDERGLCQNRALSRDPHHMGDTGCWFSGPAAPPPLTITVIHTATSVHTGVLDCCVLVHNEHLWTYTVQLGTAFVRVQGSVAQWLSVGLNAKTPG